MLDSLIWLAFTVPAANADVVDTTYWNCFGGPPTQDVATVSVHWWPISGGASYVIASKDVRGKEGQADSIGVEDRPGHYWSTATDTAGNVSCPSNWVTRLPGDMTAVEESAADPVVKTLFFDVHGRRLRGPPKASGIYFWRKYHKSGAVKQGRTVVLK